MAWHGMLYSVFLDCKVCLNCQAHESERSLPSGLSPALREVQVGKSTLHRWENNHNAPNPEQVAALCDVFACRPAVFSKPPQLRR